MYRIFNFIIFFIGTIIFAILIGLMVSIFEPRWPVMYSVYTGVGAGLLNGLSASVQLSEPVCRFKSRKG